MDLINQNIVKEFLYDTFMVDNNLKVREKYKKSSTEEEKKELYRSFLLQNLFLIRRSSDPGLYAFTLNQINENIKIKSTVKKYVYKQFTSSSTLDSDLFGSFAVEQNETLLDDEIENPVTWHFSSATKKRNNFKDVNNNSLNYLSKRLEYANKKGNDDEALVISQCIKDHESGGFFGYQIFSEDKLYREQINSHRWLYSQNQYILENIKFVSHYYNSKPFNFHYLNQFNVQNVVFVKDLLRIMGEMTGKEEKTILDDVLNYNKFINDVFSIASLVWFNTHNQEEKVDILNKEYPFEITEKMLVEYESAMHEYGFTQDGESSHILSIFAIELYNSQFLEESKMIWKYILQNATDNFTIYNCCDNLATTYREIGDNNNSLKYYKKSLKIIKELSKSNKLNIDETSKKYETFNSKIENENENEIFNYIKQFEDKIPNFDYKVAIELKNVGEMYSNLGEKNLADKCFSEAEERSSKLSVNEKNSIQFNLSCANKRLGRFDEEFKYLSKLISQKYIDSKLEKYVLDRMDILNSMEFMLANGDFDCEKLAKIENQEKANKLLKIGEALFHSFQFKNSMYYFDKEYEIEKLNGFNCFNSLNYIATYNLYYGDLQKAKHLCEKLIDNAHTSIQISIAKVNIGLIEIKENDFQKGLKQLKDACDIFNGYNDGIKTFIQTIIDSSTIFWSKENIHKIINCLESKIVSKNVDFNLLVGCAYLEIGFCDDALDYFNRGLSQDVDAETKSLLLYDKGLAHSAMGEAEKAIKMYEESISCLNSAYAWENMAVEYRNRLDILNSKECIKKAIKLVSGEEKNRLNKIKQELETLSDKRLNLNSIKESDIKKTLFTAEKLVISDVQKIEYIDDREFSSSLHHYGKALENMLDIQISNKMRKIIYQKFGDCVVEDYDYFEGIDFSFSLKNMLDKSKKESIGLGSWRSILNYVNENSKNPVYQKFKDELKNKYSLKDLEKIKFACGMIKNYRDSSTHKDVKSYYDVMIVRNKILRHLNNVIYVLYD